MPESPEGPRLPMPFPVLPDRSIYHKGTRWAYVLSLFAHSWDESHAFWETNRKTLVLQLASLALGAQVWALVRGLEYAVNEVLLGAAITLGPPLGVALLLYVLGVIKAPWRLHLRDLARYRESESTHAMSADVRTLPNRLRLLAGEITNFINSRVSGDSSGESFQEFWDEHMRRSMMAIVGVDPQRREVRQRAEAARLYQAETMTAYETKYARYVVRALDEISALPGERLRDYEHPTSTEGIRAVAKWLVAAADRLTLERASAQATQAPIAREWSVDFFGSVADLKTRKGASLSRYAVALDVEITNRSVHPASLTVELCAQWSDQEGFFKVAHARQTLVQDWETILRSFDLGQKRQLLFPLNLKTETVSGHIVFEIPNVGMGAAWLGHNIIGGLSDDGEGERERRYELQFTDKITGEPLAAPVCSVFAPTYDGSGISNRTDLAVAGHAVTLPLD